jgi:histone-lysine N-methyltransferase SETMAR
MPDPHTSAATSAAVNSIRFEVVPHPPYSPYLAPSDFWLFGALKKHLKGNHFTCEEEVQATVAKRFQEQPEKFYTKGFQKLVSAGGIVSNERGTTWKREV